MHAVILLMMIYNSDSFANQAVFYLLAVAWCVQLEKRPTLYSPIWTENLLVSVYMTTYTIMKSKSLTIPLNMIFQPLRVESNNYDWPRIGTVFLILTIASSTLIEANVEPVNHVTCGSVIKLKNDAQSVIRLHSHDINYRSGSQQQSVTGVENQDLNSYWYVYAMIHIKCLMYSM